VLPSQA
jgi:hypothetical protein